MPQIQVSEYMMKKVERFMYPKQRFVQMKIAYSYMCHNTVKSQLNILLSMATFVRRALPGSFFFPFQVTKY